MKLAILLTLSVTATAVAGLGVSVSRSAASEPVRLEDLGEALACLELRRAPPAASLSFAAAPLNLTLRVREGGRPGVGCSVFSPRGAS